MNKTGYVEAVNYMERGLEVKFDTEKYPKKYWGSVLDGSGHKTELKKGDKCEYVLEKEDKYWNIKGIKVLGLDSKPGPASGEDERQLQIMRQTATKVAAINNPGQTLHDLIDDAEKLLHYYRTGFLEVPNYEHGEEAF